jgi:hypothetical protein
LGLPPSDTKILARVLDSLALPIEHYISGCRVHTLNRGRHLTLTNAVMYLKSVYAMVALRLPKSIIERIDKPHHAIF